MAAVQPRKPTNDAEAIAEAASRPTMRFVAMKEEAQLDMQTLLSDMRKDWTELDARIAILDREFVETARRSAPERRLATIPGIGALNATALVAAVGGADGFAHGRDLAAWLGLVPRQMTTGGKPRLGGITKRGNVYLRTMLIHGARAALPGLSRSDMRLGVWLRELMTRAHVNVAVVALAAKLARIAWAVLRSGVDHDRRAGTAAA